MFDLETCVAFITNNTAKKIAEAFNERLQPLGITRVQWIALYFLGEKESITQKELAEKMNIKDSTLARLIDRMEKEGYVERVKNSGDRRFTNLVLTAKGSKSREKYLVEGEKLSAQCSKNISKEEIEIFTKVLKKMLDNIS